MSKQDTPKPISKSIRWSFVAAGIALACLSWNSYSTFPTEYAVCSSDGAIHTVDEANPIAECILVSRDRIKAVGSKGTFNKAFGASEADPAPEHVKNTAGDIQFYEVKPGSILVPGLAGLQFCIHVCLPLITAQMPTPTSSSTDSKCS